jgi:nitrogen-specific signal transduction histidine kinase
MPAVTKRRPAAFPLDATFRALMEGSESGVLLIDPQRRVESANAAALKLLGVTAARARGAEAAELLRTIVAGEDLARDVASASNLEREAVLHTPGAGDVPVLLTARRIGRPAWVLVTLRDLTSMWRMQQELRRHERLATLGQLSAGVAHEIRNPLAGIGTSAQVLLKRFDAGDDRARFVQVILDEVARRSHRHQLASTRDRARAAGGAARGFGGSRGDAVARAGGAAGRAHRVGSGGEAGAGLH